ncbi:FkbM family methyltransferase [Candidatus Pelagibacter sp.]|nr:FkbM family methyltransferase [Candidatus Pelagibacter sp.]
MIKLLKKICGLIGFKLIDKNLIKNERLISKFSYKKINTFIDKLFSNHLVDSVVQIGANDGKRFDVLNVFIKKYSPKAILVEPIKENFIDLKLNYKGQNNIFFENSAISVNNEINFLFKVTEKKLNLYDEHIKGITSFDKSHLLKHGVSKFHITTEKVNSISFNELIKKYSIENLDLLMIDAEGYDGDIIIDFLSNSSLRPLIVLEYLHIKNIVFEKLINTLISKNFVFYKLEENLICLPKDNEKFKNLI